MSEVFRIVSDKLLPEYLNLLLRRSKFDRYARFNSWGSAREVFGFAEMARVEIPVPGTPIVSAASAPTRAAIGRWRNLRSEGMGAAVFWYNTQVRCEYET